MKKKNVEPLPDGEMPEMGDLPHNWKWIPFGSIANFKNGINFNKEQKGDVGILTIDVRNMYSDSIYPIFDNLYRLNLTPKSDYHLKKGDILFVRSSVKREGVGWTTCFNGSNEPITFCGFIIRARLFDENTSSEYLTYFFRTAFARQLLINSSSQVTITNIGQDELRQISIPLPPLSEQQRIVARVETLLTQVNTARDRLNRVPLIMKKFRQVVLAAACSGRLTEGWREENPNIEPASVLLKKINNQKGNEKILKMRTDPSQSIGTEKIIENEIPESWELTNLGYLFTIHSGEAFKKSDYSQQGYKLFQIANVGFGKTIWDQQNFLPENVCKEYENLILREEDICIALNRPILGNNLKVTKISMFDLPAILYQRVGCLRSKDPMTINYSFLFMLSDVFRETVRDNLQGTDQPYLNFSLLSKLAIPLPPLAEQHEIVRRVGLLFERADAIDREVEAAGRRCERLTQAVLAKAFSGKL